MSNLSPKEKNRKISLKTPLDAKVSKSDINLEDSIIGIMLLEPDAQSKCINYFRDNFSVFYNIDNQTIYKVMRQMDSNGQRIDYVSVCAKMAMMGEISLTNDKWAYILGQKMQNVTTSAHLDTWVGLLFELYSQRLKDEISVKLVSGEMDALEARNILNRELDDIYQSQSADNWLDTSHIMLELAERRRTIESGIIKPIATGLNDLDMKLGGGLDTGFHVIAARPGMGKSAIALTMIRNMARMGNHVGLINLEMPTSQLSARLISMQTGIPFNRIYKEKQLSSPELDLINRQIAELSYLPIAVSKSVRFNKDDIKYAIRNAKKRFNTKCIFIDYLQLIELKSERNKLRHELIGELSRELKLLSSELQIPIVALAQVNRESESGADKVSKPAKLSQLRESGSIEQDIDTGMIVDRPYKRGVMQNENGESMINIGLLDIQKHRNGEEGMVELHFDEKRMLFKDKQQNIF